MVHYPIYFSKTRSLFAITRPLVAFKMNAGSMQLNIGFTFQSLKLANQLFACFNCVKLGCCTLFTVRLTTVNSDCAFVIRKTFCHLFLDCACPGNKWEVLRQVYLTFNCTGSPFLINTISIIHFTP